MKLTKAGFLWLITVLIWSSSFVSAQSFRHLDQVYELRTYQTLDEWLGRAESLREHILVSNGLWPMPVREQVNPIVSDPVRRDGYTIQNVVIETIPGFYLTGNLYRPTEGTAPYPAVLSAHGHWRNGRLEDSETGSIPGRAINFARQGYIVFTYSMIGYNENEGVIPHRFDDPQYQLWGFMPMALQLWNSTRALDFLSSLPDVDTERIGMTGASGGGTQTFMLTAVDPRIRVAAPVNMISAHMQGGCVCENAPLLRLDANNIEIGALAAPRPLMMVSATGDWTRNTPTVEYPAMQAIYRLFGAEDRVANVHLDYEHNYNKDSREAVYSWFARWLQGKEGPVREEPFEVEEPEVLLADLPAQPLSLDELFPQHVNWARGEIDRHRPSNWPEIYSYRESFGVALEHVLEAEVASDDVELDVFVPESRSGASSAVLIVHANHPRAAEEAAELARRNQARGRLAFVLNPYPDGDSFVPPDTINHWNTYNPTVTARRIGEIRAAATQILSRPDVKSIDLVGLKGAGPMVMLARALLPEVYQTQVDFAGFDPESDEVFLEKLFIPLLRRAGDFRSAAVMIVPAPLTIKNLPPGSTRTWIENVYQAAGASQMLTFE